MPLLIYMFMTTVFQMELLAYMYMAAPPFSPGTEYNAQISRM